MTSAASQFSPATFSLKARTLTHQYPRPTVARAKNNRPPRVASTGREYALGVERFFRRFARFLFPIVSIGLVEFNDGFLDDLRMDRVLGGFKSPRALGTLHRFSQRLFRLECGPHNAGRKW